MELFVVIAVGAVVGWFTPDVVKWLCCIIKKGGS